MILDNLYTIVKKNDDIAEIKLTNASHPLFKAHFENNPLLPAFIHVDIIEVIFSFKITKIKKAKFIKFVKPLEILTYKRQNNKITVYVGDEEVGNFVF